MGGIEAYFWRDWRRDALVAAIGFALRMRTLLANVMCLRRAVVNRAALLRTRLCTAQPCATSYLDVYLLQQCTVSGGDGSRARSYR
jgi:hypothetical protein